MREFFFYCSIGVLSVGWLTGCSASRPAADTSCSRTGVAQPGCAPCQSGAPSQTSAPIQGAQSVPMPVGTKSVDATPVRLSPEVKTLATPAKPAAAPVTPVVPPLAPPPPAPPQLPATIIPPVLPPLPAPPSWKTVSQNGTLPSDKIIVVSNLEPDPAKAMVLDLIDASKLVSAVVPASRKIESPPIATRETPAAIKGAPIPLSHDENFTTVTGQVQAFRKTFRLRYLAIDQEDLYGGVVTLESSLDLTLLRDGTHVRVRGVLIPPTERNETARYRVTALEILD